MAHNKATSVQEKKMAKKSELIEKLIDPNIRQECLIMFSGGKDSTFLAHTFSAVYNNQVTAFTCDNGFEENSIWTDTKEKAAKIGIAHATYAEHSFIFKHIFKAIISEREVFTKYGSYANLICLFCCHLFWLFGVRYASKNKIPFVVHGMDPGQIRLLLGKGAKLGKNNLLNNVFISRLMKQTLTDLIAAFKNSEAYKTSGVAEAIDALLPFPDDVITVYPFSFLDYDPREMMAQIQEKYGWVPPNDRHIKYYAGSGCRLENIFKELEKLGILTDLEATNVRNMKKKYKMNSMDLFQRGLADFFNKKTVNLQYQVYDEIGIKPYLIEECKKKKLRYLA
jgi:hypothetical protein